MNGRTVRSAVLLSAIAALLFATAVSAAETVLRTEPFLLVPPEGPTAVVPFQIQQPGTVILEITTTQPVPLIGVVARGAGGKASPFRKDGRTPLRLEFMVTRQDLDRGNTWYAFPTLVAPNKKIYAVPGGMAAGSLKVSFVPAQSGPVTTRQVPPGTATLASPPPGTKTPPPKAMTTTMLAPPVTLTVPPPPPGLKLPPGGKTPPPGTATPPPPGGGSVPPPPPPGTAPPPPVSGKYRVTINGIRVNHATWDTMLQTDGKGDEIFVVVDVADMKAAGSLVPDSSSFVRAVLNLIGPSKTVTTKVYGDTNSFPSRIQAGSLSGRGGIQTGDDIPGPSPWMRGASPQTDRFPLLVWEGRLVDNQTSVMIIPAIWEQDSTDRVASVYNQAANIWGSTLKPMWDLWNSGLLDPTAYNRLLFGGLGSALSTPMNTLIGRLIPGASLNPMDLITNWLGAEITKVVGESKDRPIGMTESAGKYVFVPQVITLNYRIAEGTIAPNPLHRAPGVFEVRYVDAARLAGDYTMYVQIEKIQ
jgi:hypothetical protein